MLSVNLVSSENLQHAPVMVREVLDFLAIEGDGCYVDATGGGGSHTKSMAEALNKNGKLFTFERDKKTSGALQQTFADDSRITIVPRAFSQLNALTSDFGVSQINGILFDLGISSIQLNDPERGLSFSNAGPLDMRMDQTSSTNAADLLNERSQEELADIFFKYGDERRSRHLANVIVDCRQKHPFKTTTDLREVIIQALRPGAGPRLTKTLARLFMALRIAVNHEFEELESALTQTEQLLAPNGRAVVLSYHSGEDRIVKHFFRSSDLEVLTKKPLKPTDDEVLRNNRSRSALLRAAKKSSQP